MIGILLLYQFLGYLNLESSEASIEAINLFNFLVFLSQLLGLIGFGTLNIIFYIMIPSNDENDEKIIRKTALDFGTKYSRVEIREISEKCNKNPRFIIQVIEKMINDKEIYAQYFSSTKSVAFDKNTNIEEINNLMKKYENWERKKKKNNE